MNRGSSLSRLRLAFALGVCVAALMVTGAGNRATAQQGQGKYVVQATERLANLIGKGNADKYKLTTNRFSLGGGWLNQGTKWESLFSITLEAGKQYRLLAAGDNDAEDVDLQILDPAGTVMKKDVKRDPTAVVDFTPAKTLRYLIQVRVFASIKNRPSFTVATVMAK